MYLIVFSYFVGVFGTKATELFKDDEEYQTQKCIMENYFKR